MPRSWASALLPPQDQLRSSAFRPVFPALLPREALPREVAAEPRELRDPAAELRDLRDLRDPRDLRDVHHPADLTRDREEPDEVTRLDARLESRGPEDVKSAAELLRDVSYKREMVVLLPCDVAHLLDGVGVVNISHPSPPRPRNHQSTTKRIARTAPQTTTRRPSWTSRLLRMAMTS